MSETLQWARPANGAFEQSGAWLANGSSTSDTPTAATAVQFATGSSSAYTVSGTGTAASLASLDLLTLTGTVDVGGSLSVGGGILVWPARSPQARWQSARVRSWWAGCPAPAGPRARHPGQHRHPASR